jgi:hypothetical protein
MREYNKNEKKETENNKNAKLKEQKIRYKCYQKLGNRTVDT